MKRPHRSTQSSSPTASPGGQERGHKTGAKRKKRRERPAHRGTPARGSPEPCPAGAAAVQGGTGGRLGARHGSARHRDGPARLPVAGARGSPHAVLCRAMLSLSRGGTRSPHHTPFHPIFTLFHPIPHHFTPSPTMPSHPTRRERARPPPTRVRGGARRQEQQQQEQEQQQQQQPGRSPPPPAGAHGGHIARTGAPGAAALLAAAAEQGQEQGQSGGRIRAGSGQGQGRGRGRSSSRAPPGGTRRAGEEPPGAGARSSAGARCCLVPYCALRGAGAGHKLPWDAEGAARGGCGVPIPGGIEIPPSRPPPPEPGGAAEAPSHLGAPGVPRQREGALGQLEVPWHGSLPCPQTDPCQLPTRCPPVLLSPSRPPPALLGGFSILSSRPFPPLAFLRAGKIWQAAGRSAGLVSSLGVSSFVGL